MKKDNEANLVDELRPEYDFSRLQGGVRGKYAGRWDRKNTMAQHPLNLALRFVLEILALISVGYWGWQYGAGAVRYFLAIGLPLLAAVLWGVFRPANEPAHSAPAPVPVPGSVRLLLELALFGFATWGLFNAGATRAAVIFAGVALLHYAISYDRVWWLLKH